MKSTASRAPTRLSDVGFTLRAGEIVGIWVCLALVAPNSFAPWSDSIRSTAGGCAGVADDGSLAEISPAALYTHTGLVTEDRRGEGLFLPLSAADNIVLPSLRRIATFAGIIDRRKQKTIAGEMIRRLEYQGVGR